MGSRRLPPFFRSGAEQGFLQGPVHHVRREHAFLLQTPQNAVPPFQRTFRMPEGVQEGRPLRQPRQQGAFRQGQAGHLPAKVETRRSSGPPAQISVIQAVEIGLQNFLLAHAHLHAPGLEKLPGLGPQVPACGRIGILGELLGDGGRPGHNLPACGIRRCGAGQRQEIRPSVAEKAFVFRRQGSLKKHVRNLPEPDRLRVVIIRSRQCGDSAAVPVQDHGAPLFRMEQPFRQGNQPGHGIPCKQPRGGQPSGNPKKGFPLKELFENRPVHKSAPHHENTALTSPRRRSVSGEYSIRRFPACTSAPPWRTGR